MKGLGSSESTFGESTTSAKFSALCWPNAYRVASIRHILYCGTIWPGRLPRSDKPPRKDSRRLTFSHMRTPLILLQAGMSAQKGARNSVARHLRRVGKWALSVGTEI